MAKDHPKISKLAESFRGISCQDAAIIAHATARPLLDTYSISSILAVDYESLLYPSFTQRKDFKPVWQALCLIKLVLIFKTHHLS